MISTRDPNYKLLEKLIGLHCAVVNDLWISMVNVHVSNCMQAEKDTDVLKTVLSI